MEQLAGEGRTDVRWWCGGELASARDIVIAARDLPGQLTRLLRDGVPDAPLRLGS